MKEVNDLWNYFLLGLVSAFSVTFVTTIATAFAKRLFGETQKSPPKASANVTVVVIFVYY